MALNFPASPVDGQIYFDSVSGNRYIYVAATTKWQYTANNNPYTGTANNQILFNNQNAISGNNGLIFIAGSNTAYFNTVNVSTNVSATYFIGNGSALTGIVTDFSPAYNTANAAFGAANQAGVIANSSYGKANSINSFATINVSTQSNVVASLTSDVLKLSSDGSLNITTNNTTKTINFALANTFDYGLITGAITTTNDYGSIA